MVQHAMGIQAHQGVCFASAKYLASRAKRDEKTWDRTLKWLKGMGLVEVVRLHWSELTKQVHKLAVNAIDFTALWEAFWQWVRPRYGKAGMAGTLDKYGYHNCSTRPGGADACIEHPGGRGGGGLPPEQEARLFRLFDEGRGWVARWELGL